MLLKAAPSSSLLALVATSCSRTFKLPAKDHAGFAGIDSVRAGVRVHLRGTGRFPGLGW